MSFVNGADIDDMFELLWSEEEQLDGWEKEFLESANGQWAFRESLTHGQHEKLIEIYRKYSE